MSAATFPSRRIERAAYRDIGVRFAAANLHPDHGTIAVFRRTSTAAIEAAFLQVLLLARESGRLRPGTVSVDGTKIDANASKTRSVRYGRARQLRAKPAAAIAALTAEAEAADAAGHDPQALPEALARRKALKARLGAACTRLEAEARAEGRRGRPPKPPEETPPSERQSSLTGPDSALMRRSGAHEYRQAHNAQAVVCAGGSWLILATNLVAATADAPSLAASAPGTKQTIGLPKTVLAGRGLASGPAVAALLAAEIDPLVAIGRTQPHRPYGFRPPPKAKAARRITEPWRVAMKAKLQTQDGKTRYKKRKRTVEPVLGIIKSATGFVRFYLRGPGNAADEWRPTAPACNCRRLARLQAA